MREGCVEYTSRVQYGKPTTGCTAHLRNECHRVYGMRAITTRTEGPKRGGNPEPIAQVRRTPSRTGRQDRQLVGDVRSDQPIIPFRFVPASQTPLLILARFSYFRSSCTGLSFQRRSHAAMLVSESHMSFRGSLLYSPVDPPHFTPPPLGLVSLSTLLIPLCTPLVLLCTPRHALP
jgi:hypothetical protein